MKTQVQKECEKRKKTHPCDKCGKGNIRDGIYLSTCQHCDASIDCSYLFAPWGLSWDQLQALHDKFETLFKENS